MHGVNGSIIGTANFPNGTIASGVWTLSEQFDYTIQGVWPTS
jgi:hypothetical protein